MTEKQVNYTDEMVATLRAGYDGSASDEARRAQIKGLAEAVGRSEASVRAKLVREGIYVPYAKAEAGKGGARKADLVQEIADRLDVHVEVIESLEKATKVALNKVLEAL